MSTGNYVVVHLTLTGYLREPPIGSNNFSIATMTIKLFQLRAHAYGVRRVMPTFPLTSLIDALSIQQQ